MRSYVYTFEPWEHQQLTWIHQTDLVKICVCLVRVSGLMVVCFPSRYQGISVVDAQDWIGSYLPSSRDLWVPSPVPRTQVWVYLELTQGLVQLNDRSFSYFPWWHQHDPRLMMLLITVIIVIRNNNSSQNDVMKLSVHCQCYLLILRFTDSQPSRETWDSQGAGSRFESEDNCYESSIITSWYKNAQQLSPTKIFWSHQKHLVNLPTN